MTIYTRHELDRCPFVRLVAAGRDDAARRMAMAPPDPAEAAVADELVGMARQHLADTKSISLADGPPEVTAGQPDPPPA